MFYVRWWTNANAIVNHACRLCKSGLKLHKMKFDMIRKCCWGGGRQAKRGGERKNTYLFNKPYWCEILGVKFCMILKSNQAQWKVVNEKITKYEPFWKKHYQYCSGQFDDCHNPKPMVACEWLLNIPRSQWCFTFDTLKVMTFTNILCTYFFFNHVSLSSH